jgi:hypothetical protein
MIAKMKSVKHSNSDEGTVACNTSKTELVRNA